MKVNTKLYFDWCAFDPESAFRELGKTASYFHEGCRIRNYEPDEILVASLLFRPINRWETFHEANIFPGIRDFDTYLEGLCRWWKDGRTTFTRNHQTRTFNEYLITAKYVERELKAISRAVFNAESVIEVYERIYDVPYLGLFFSWQVVSDLLEARLLTFSQNDWVAMGSGARAAGDILTGQHLTERECLDLMRFVQSVADIHLKKRGVRYPNEVDSYTLKNVEHGFCEFSKAFQKGEFPL